MMVQLRITVQYLNQLYFEIQKFGEIMNDQLGKSLQHSVNQKFGRGTYRVLQPIKRGKDGYVYKIQFIKQKRLGALKVLPKTSLDIEVEPGQQDEYKKKYKHDTNLQRKAQNQIKIHSSLHSSYIVKLENCCKDQMNYYLILQYIKRGDLGDQINRHKKGLHINRIRKIGLQLAKGIDTIHKKLIIHRDIKAQNILLTEDDQIKICDFSCAIEANLKKNEYLQDAIGTLEYMAPEILGKYNNSVDVWSYGCVLYAMATGNVPFKLQKYVLGQYIRKINESSIRQLNKNMIRNIKQLAFDNERQSQGFNYKMDCQCLNNNHENCYYKLGDLLNKILVHDVRKRMSLNDIIKHPFFTGQFLEQIKQSQAKLNQEQQIEEGSQGIKRQSDMKRKPGNIISMRTEHESIKQDDKEENKTNRGIRRPSSLQTLKRNTNSSIKKNEIQQQIQKKVKRATQQILQKHRQIYKRTEKNQQKKQNNQNYNIINIEQDLGKLYSNKTYNLKVNNNNNSDKYKDIDELMKYKLNAKYDYETITNSHQNTGKLNKFIGDGKVPKQNQSSCPSEHNNSRKRIIEPLNSQGIRYTTQLSNKEMIIINEQGLKSKFVNSQKCMLISPRGYHITIYVQDKIAKKYELDRLPQKYMKYYEDYKSLVDSHRKKRDRSQNNKNTMRILQKDRQLRGCKTSRQKEKLEKQACEEKDKNNGQSIVCTTININFCIWINGSTIRVKKPGTQIKKQYTVQLKLNANSNKKQSIQMCIAQKNQTISNRTNQYRTINQSNLQGNIKSYIMQQLYQRFNYKELCTKQELFSLNQRGLITLANTIIQYVHWFNSVPISPSQLQPQEPHSEQNGRNRRITQQSIKDEPIKNQYVSKSNYNSIDHQTQTRQIINGNKKIGLSQLLRESQQKNKKRQRYEKQRYEKQKMVDTNMNKKIKQNYDSQHKFYDHRLLLDKDTQMHKYR